MFIQQFFVNGIAHSSYLLGGTEACAIIDPMRDVEIYVQAARTMRMNITHILETHLHADFVSGHLDLAQKTGAIIYAPHSAHCKFEHKPLKEGDEIELENMVIRVLETPGHTPEHISYVVTDYARGQEPVVLFSGDTLFVGDVGRPDLFPGKEEELAVSLYHSLYDKLLRLPDFCEIYPSHGAGSLCGRAMGAKRSSTMGYEKRYNSALQIQEETKFIQHVTANMPGVPDHFSRCSAINANGPELVKTLPHLKPLNASIFKRMFFDHNMIILDIRNYEAFGGQHIPGAYNIDFGGNFATFAGWILPPEKQILMVADSIHQAQEATIWLKRVGLDHTIGFLEGGMFEWAKAGFSAEHVPQLSSEELHTMSVVSDGMVLLDVRSSNEYNKDHIKGALNIPVADIRTRYHELDKNQQIVLICSTGHRSSLGASLLKQRSFKTVYNVAGGMIGYGAAGYGPECPVCVAPHVSSFLWEKKTVPMPNNTRGKDNYGVA